jgi:hypothetical protein
MMARATRSASPSGGCRICRAIGGPPKITPLSRASSTPTRTPCRWNWQASAIRYPRRERPGDQRGSDGRGAARRSEFAAGGQVALLVSVDGISPQRRRGAEISAVFGLGRWVSGTDASAGCLIVRFSVKFEVLGGLRKRGRPLVDVPGAGDAVTAVQDAEQIGL